MLHPKQLVPRYFHSPRPCLTSGLWMNQLCSQKTWPRLWRTKRCPVQIHVWLTWMTPGAQTPQVLRLSTYWVSPGSKSSEVKQLLVSLLDNCGSTAGSFKSSLKLCCWLWLSNKFCVFNLKLLKLLPFFCRSVFYMWFLFTSNYLFVTFLISFMHDSVKRCLLP